MSQYLIKYMYLYCKGYHNTLKYKYLYFKGYHNT